MLFVFLLEIFLYIVLEGVVYHFPRSHRVSSARPLIVIYIWILDTLLLENARERLVNRRVTRVAFHLDRELARPITQRSLYLKSLVRLPRRACTIGFLVTMRS